MTSLKNLIANTGMSPAQAMAACIGRGGKLAEFMRKHRAEVDTMYLFGVDFEKIHREAMIEEARNEGLSQGLADGVDKGRREDARNALALGLPLTQISQITGLSIEDIQALKAAPAEPVLA